MAPNTHEALLRMRDMQITLPSLLEENPDVREELLAESRKLLLSLERPDNVVARICFQVSCLSLARLRKRLDTDHSPFSCGKRLPAKLRSILVCSISWSSPRGHV